MIQNVGKTIKKITEMKMHNCTHKIWKTEFGKTNIEFSICNCKRESQGHDPRSRETIKYYSKLGEGMHSFFALIWIDSIGL